MAIENPGILCYNWSADGGRPRLLSGGVLLAVSGGSEGAKPAALELSGGRESYEIRHRGFMPISFIRLNSYEMSQSLIV
jgi:hypothetical protein